ncbi:MAG: DNRLRE domain-containing protein, partial [Candidatus Poseidoniaceae archaeon]|nr:DNRLRE domain-containing protein [Candidatus Poseidoniaceae archaeon]
NDSNPDDDYLFSGEMTDGSLATSLMKIPLTDIPMPQNATLKQAILNFYCEWGSSSSQRISIHAVNGSWNDSATGLTRDGVNNWTAASASAVEDIRDDEFFIVQNVTVSSWMEFDITDLAQKAHAGGATHIEFAIVGDDDRGLVKLSSTESTSDPPWLNLTWATGAQAVAEVAATGGVPDGEILWDNSTVGLYPAGTPTLSWNHSNSSSIDAWRLYILHDSLDARIGWNTFDSRSDSGFNLSNLSYIPPSNLSNGKCYIWYVQPVDDDVFGEYSNRYTFCLPKWIGEALNSTDAYANIRDGGFLPQDDLPDYFKDSWLDQTYVNNNHGSNSSLVIGASPHNVNNAATTVLMYNLTGNGIKTPFEVVGATLSLYKTGGLSNTQNISVSVLYDGFEENNVTWSQRVNGVTWNSGGGLGSLDAGLPIDMVEVLDDGRYTWDITQAAQLGHLYGYQTAWFIFRTEDSRAPWHEFASSEHSNVEYRPELNLTWRTGNGWTPSDVGGQNPSNGQTVWGLSSERPTHPNPLVLEWNSTDTNVSEWQIQYSTNNRFIGDFVNSCSSLTCATSSNGTPFFDFANLSFSIPVNSSLTIDDWTYWRVRSLQGDRIGNWTSANSFRVPSPQGTDDGTGNYSVTLYRDSVFRYSGSLPTVPDTWIDSSSTSTNHGSSTNLTLGMSHGGNGDSRILIEFDLDELAFPTNMIPTQTLLKLYRYQVVGVTPVTISAHACDSFSQSGVTFSSAPACNSTEITRSTLGIFPPQAWVEWDITSLAQSNILSGNRTLTVMLAATGTPSTITIFRSSEYSNLSLRPKLVFDYVDNANGSVPPAQPTLLSPSDGQVVYEADNWTLSPKSSPLFEWNPVSGATGYILTISNDTGRNKYRSWMDSGFNGSSYSLSSALEVGESYEWWVQAINGSIPGPSSSRWSFAVGNPVNNSYNGDLTWTYELRHGQEVPKFAHPDIGDGWIGNHSLSASHPDEDILVGQGCGNGAGIMFMHECRGMFTVDISDIPLPTDSNAHSASIRFIVSNINVLNGGMGMTLSVHPLLTLPFNPQASNWNASSAGNMWSTSGLQPGIDYGPALDTISISMMSMGQELWLDLTYPGLDLSTANHFILIGTTVGIGQMYAELHSSEASVEQMRPLVLFNYTNVDSVVINPGTGISTDADTNVSFTHTLYDLAGGLLSQSVDWSSDNGSIFSNGLFVPHTVGIWDISACFGAICDTV